jgi:hypothetical protein
VAFCPLLYTPPLLTSNNLSKKKKKEKLYRMKAASCFLFVFGLGINLFQLPTLVSAGLVSLDSIVTPAASDANNATIPEKYIVELASSASGDSTRKRSLTVSTRE